MATIKEAVVLAQGFLKEMIPDSESVRLEQATLDERGVEWSIVLSYEEPTNDPFSAKGGRIWKVVDVDRENSELLGLRAWGL